MSRGKSKKWNFRFWGSMPLDSPHSKGAIITGGWVGGGVLDVKFNTYRDGEGGLFSLFFTNWKSDSSELQ